MAASMRESLPLSGLLSLLFCGFLDRNTHALLQKNVPMKIPVRVLPNGIGLPLPAYATEQSACVDLYAAIAEPICLAPDQRVSVPTGLAIALPMGYEAQIRSRSGLAFKHGVCVLNAPGTIDADYRGEICVLLVNWGAEAFTIARGMRIAQMAITAFTHVQWETTDTLSTTERGTGGFGSTGLS